MASTTGMYVNLVKYRTDQQSYKKVRDEAKRLQKDFNKILSGNADSGLFSPSSSRVARKQDAHMKARTKELKKQQRIKEQSFNTDKKRQASESKSRFQSALSGLTSGSGGKASNTAFADMLRAEDAANKNKIKNEKRAANLEAAKEVRIERFLNTLKGIDKNEKDIYRTQLMQQNTAIGLVRRQQEIRKFTQDNYRTQQKITAEMNKQGIAAKRFQGSLAQMVGTGASVYTGAAIGGSLLQTGMGFEAMNKTFLAVSDNAEQAAQHFAFIKDVSMTYGTDILQAGKQFGKIIAAGRRKLGLEELKDLYVSVTEAGVALGLTQDQTSRTFNALNQMLSKGQVYAEELRGQLGEHLPFAMEAMAKGAKEAGLIDKSITDVGELEKRLNKLMEQGKIASKDVLPAFGRALRALASGDTDAVATALRENLNPQLGIAMNQIKLFGNEIYKGGLKQGIFSATQGFNKLMNETNLLAKAIGGFLNGAITGLTFPIRLMVAGIQDLWYWSKKSLGITDEMEVKFVSLGSTIFGVVAGVATLVWGLKKLVGLGKIAFGKKSVAEKVMESFSGKDGKGGIFSGMKGSSATNPLYVVVVGDTSDVVGSGGGKGGKSKSGKSRGSVGSVIRKVAPVVAEVGAGVALGAMFNAKPYVPNADLTAGSGYMTPEQMSKAMKDTIKVDVTVNPDSNGFMYKVEKTIDNKIIRSQDDMIRDAYMQQ